MTTTKIRQERGSVAIELAIIAPVVLLLILLVVAAGTVARATSTIDAAAFAAARAASISRTAGDARTQANDVAAATLSSRGVSCAPQSMSIDTGGFSAPVGTSAAVTVSLTCRVPLSRLVQLPGLPGSHTVTSTATSSIDSYRGRS